MINYSLSCSHFTLIWPNTTIRFFETQLLFFEDLLSIQNVQIIGTLERPTSKLLVDEMLKVNTVHELKLSTTHHASHGPPDDDC